MTWKKISFLDSYSHQPLSFVKNELTRMILRSEIVFALFWAFSTKVNTLTLNSGELTEFLEPSYCAVDEYFDVNLLKCITCDSDKNLTPSPDGLFCVCDERSKIKQWNFASFPICEPCKENEKPTSDHLDCLPCSTFQDNSTVCDDFQCPSDAILVQRTSNGSLVRENICQECEPGMEPSSSGTSCVPCKQTFTTGNRGSCSCTEGQLSVDGVCFKKNWPDDKSMYSVLYLNGIKVESQFLKENLLRGIFFCKMGNQTACQLTANMCVMTMYKDTHPASPCSIFRDRKRIPTSKADSVPWLYYGEGEAPTVLSRKQISAQFNLNRQSAMGFLNLTGVVFSPDGTFKEIRRISGFSLQLCPASWKSLDESFRFAANYHLTCRISSKQLLASAETEFIDLYLRFRGDNGDLLYALPVLVYDLKHGDFYVNKASDRLQWQLVRRMFLIDKLSGLKFEEDRSRKGIPEVVRYAKSMTLNVKLLGRREEGKIYVPYLSIEYGEITRDDIEKDVEVILSFRVDYQMDNSLSHALEVCMGVFSGLAIVWSGIRTWSNSKRSGRLAIDFVTITQLILFTCGNLANVFFLTVFCASLYFFVFFKGQSVPHVLLPTASQEEVIKLYLVFAFFLKLVEIVQLIYNQITIDIFFIDWERPRARNLIPRKSRTSLRNLENDEEQPVSIWRTYFVANEWNEIQTQRKLDVNLHLLLSVFILKVAGLEYWATSDPEIYNSLPSDGLGKEFSFTCRFAVGASVYITLYAIQRLFGALIYERFIKNGIQEFVDLCSIANISVFILAYENYGYYIHGRSAHGFADTDMQNIINQLQREEDDLVGHRGLLPGTDQQTFEMTVPTQLRAYYRKMMAPLKNMSQPLKRITISTISGRSKMASETLDKSVQAYHNMNRFLAAFLEHALKDLDYQVRDKLFTESLLGIEFSDPSEKGVFYSDNGHSFDNVLFYGNEFVLFTLDIMLFSCVIALLNDYLVAGMITAAFAHVITLIRKVGARKNLAKKTLIDERFLI